jgi:hypothetical protein
MSVSLLPQVVDALVSAMRAVAGYRDPAETDGETPVFDGPAVGLSGDHAVSWLAIGATDDPGSPGTVAVVRQETTAVGRVRREESVDISCVAGAQSGDVAAVTMSSLRTAVMGIVSDVEAVTRASPTLGIAAPRLVVEVSSVDELQQWAARGLNVTVRFTVSYRGRI